MHIFVAASNFAKDNPSPIQYLKSAGLQVRLNTSGQRLNAAQLAADAKAAEGIIAGLEAYSSEVLAQLPGLKCISRCGVGLDTIDLAAAHSLGIKVLNTPDAVIQPVAELTIAMIFDLLRNVTAQAALMRQRRWERKSGLQLAGKTIGIVGLGRIGKKVAELLKHLDCRVLGHDYKPDEAWAMNCGVQVTDLARLLSESDIVSIHVTAQAANPWKMGKPEFDRMKKGAFVVNTARGNLIDEEALVAALQSGQLAGAALDVFNQEPYDGPLCDLTNVILTPHAATFTKESRLEMEMQAAQNIVNFFHGTK